jgi:hypothetical protein
MFLNELISVRNDPIQPCTNFVKLYLFSQRGLVVQEIDKLILNIQRSQLRFLLKLCFIMKYLEK